MEKAKKAVGVGVVGIVVAAVFMFLQNGFGLGGGDGLKDGDSDVAIQPESQAEVTQEPEEETETTESSEELSDVIVVTIQENKVLVGENEFDKEADFKSYMEETYVDSVKYELKEVNSIQSTYEWVTKVFEDLSIEYSVEAE